MKPHRVTPNTDEPSDRRKKLSIPYKKSLYTEYKTIAKQHSTLHKMANMQVCVPKCYGNDSIGTLKLLPVDYAGAMLLQNDNGELTFVITIGTFHCEIKLTESNKRGGWLSGTYTAPTVSNDQVNSSDDILDLKELEHKKKVLELETEIVNLRIQLMENKS